MVFTIFGCLFVKKIKLKFLLGSMKHSTILKILPVTLPVPLTNEEKQTFVRKKYFEDMPILPLGGGGGHIYDDT